MDIQVSLKETQKFRFELEKMVLIILNFEQTEFTSLQQDTTRNAADTQMIKGEKIQSV